MKNFDIPSFFFYYGKINRVGTCLRHVSSERQSVTYLHVPKARPYFLAHIPFSDKCLLSLHHFLSEIFSDAKLNGCKDK